MKKYILITIALIGFAITAQAQVKLNHLNAGLSYWERSYEGMDERAFIRGFNNSDGFKQGGFVPHIGAEVGLFRGLAVDGRVGIWTASFDNETRFADGLTISEEIKQTIIPVSLGLVYNFGNLFQDNWNLFAGAGLNRYFIQNKVERVVTGGEGANSSATFSGNDYGSNVKAGVEYMISENMGLSLEGRYNSGSYEQKFQEAEDSPMQTYEVSLRGIEIGLTFRYRFSPVYKAAAPQTQNAE